MEAGHIARVVSPMLQVFPQAAEQDIARAMAHNGNGEPYSYLARLRGEYLKE